MTPNFQIRMIICNSFTTVTQDGKRIYHDLLMGSNFNSWFVRANAQDAQNHMDPLSMMRYMYSKLFS